MEDENDWASAMGAPTGGGSGGGGGNLGSIINGGSGALQGISQLVGGQISANAAQNIANAQRNQAEWLQGQGAQITAPTASELALQGQQLSLYSQFLQQQLQLLSAVNPTLLQAGRNLLALQQGGNAPQTQAAQNYLAQGQKDLQAQLQQQFGSGAAANTSYQNAMTRYNQQSALTLGQLNQEAMSGYQQYLGSLPGVANQGFAGAGGVLNNAYGNQQEQQRLQLGALNAAAPYLSNTAGSQYTKSAEEGNVVSGLGKTLGNIASSIGGLFG